MEDVLSVSSLAIWFVIPLAVLVWLLVRRSKAADRESPDIGTDHDKL